MALKIKKNGWIAIIMLIVIGVVFTLFQTNKDNEDSFFGKKKDYLTIGLDTYAGWAGITHLNGGLEPNEDCELYKKFGIKLKIMIVENDRDGFKAGDVDVTFVTGDVRPIEMSENSVMSDSRVFALANISRGADALVVNKTINTVNDLKGKRGAYPPGQAGHTLLMEVLETSGLKSSDVTLAQFFKDEGGKEIKVENGMDAALAYKANQADFALVYSPDDQDLVKSIPGTKILFTTKQAPNIIVDCWMATEQTILKKKDDLVKLTEALLYSNVELVENDEFLKDAAYTFSKAFAVDPSFICETDNNGNVTTSVRDVLRFNTLGDNSNFFGLNPSYHGITGEVLYNKMSRKYEEIGLAKRPAKWLRTIDLSIIESLNEHNNLQNDQTAELIKSYTAPTETQINTAKAVSNKSVIIEFNMGSSILDSNAQYIIDTEFAEIAKNFTNYIRVEGNTDNTGSAEVNKRLSQQRAQVVIEYLIKEHSIDRNRFLPAIGNGSKYAIDAGSVGADRQYRNTAFQLMNE